MTARRRSPRAPAGLQAAGRALWRRLHEVPGDPEGVVTFEPRELVVLEAACRQADDIARLQDLVDEQGVVVKGSQGQPRLSSVLTEVRQGRLALARLIGELELPDFSASIALPDEPTQPPALTARARQARRAAQRRWDNDARRKGRIGSG